MKNFVKENWYKLMIGSSMMMASFGFMIYAISPAYSNSDKEKTTLKELPNNQKVIQVPVNEDGSVNVKLSKEQIKEIREPQGSQDVMIVGWSEYTDGSYDRDLPNYPLPVK
jgi:hypothetical protein